VYKPPSSAKPLDLGGAFLKVQRAKKHIADLSEERIAFLGTNHYYGAPEFDVKTNRTRFTLESVPDIPAEIRLLLGDAAHCLRTALDHLACELVRSTGIVEPKVYFPICGSEQIYKAESAGKTKGMPDSAKQLIDRLNPYGGGNHLLWGLHQLDIIDKHRLLLTTTLKTGAWSVTLDQTARDYSFAFNSALKAGDVIGDLEGNHESDKRMSVTPDIAFGEPEVFAGEALFPTLTILANYVEEIIREYKI
jgi:hypothetical protein